MIDLKEKFRDTYGYAPAALFSAPGRTELSGNHTDHQHGCVLAAAVQLTTDGAASENGTEEIRILSEGYPAFSVSLKELSPIPGEAGTCNALVRGMAAGFVKCGCTVGGFDACIDSDVLPGSGLSSSAAFEVLIGRIINGLFGCGLDDVAIARIAQASENVYFGKPCGLMDQLASSVGGIVGIDLRDPAAPAITRMDAQLKGYTLCIVHTGADHADLTADYAAIPAEMRSAAALFGKEVLRDVDETDFYAQLSDVRRQCGDRATLRAMHFFAENRRVLAQIDALQRGDTDTFLALVNASGTSSWELLQNIVPAGYVDRQPVAAALALAQHLLQGQGACRVHGGGFAGTIQAFVPDGLLGSFRQGMEGVLGAGCCVPLTLGVKHKEDQGEKL